MPVLPAALGARGDTTSMKPPAAARVLLSGRICALRTITSPGKLREMNRVKLYWTVSILTESQNSGSTGFEM